MSAPTASTWADGESRPIFLQFANRTAARIDLFWLGYEGEEVPFGSVSPGRVLGQSTFTTHPWRVRSASGKILGDYLSGQAGVLEVHAARDLRFRCAADDKGWQKPEWGAWRQRGLAVGGIPIMAYDCVGDEAVRVAGHTVAQMLAAAPPDVVRRMIGNGAKLAIIGCDQVTTDVPDHHFLKHSEGDRDIDATTRGLGGSVCVPTTSCGEENILMHKDCRYYSESILVHEFGHSVMALGLTDEQQATIGRLYSAAHASGRFNLACYAMSNEDEYWAEFTQAWFDATVRTDVTSGVTTREAVKERDPELAAFMVEVYGDGAWRYPHDAPGCFTTHRRPGAGERANGTTAAGVDGTDGKARPANDTLVPVFPQLRYGCYAWLFSTCMGRPGRRGVLGQGSGHLKE